jgi:hypothetical protein
LKVWSEILKTRWIRRAQVNVTLARDVLFLIKTISFSAATAREQSVHMSISSRIPVVGAGDET